MALNSSKDDPVLILLRKIRSQLDQLEDEIIDLLAEEQPTEKEPHGKG